SRFLHDVLFLAQRAASAGATRSAFVPGRFNLLVLAQCAGGSCATRSVTLFFLFFFYYMRNARAWAAQRAVYLVRVDFC
ncbi:hypothetical protein A2U01_0070144, partial [Trifolium medium]|nr:hypothetical protein [Trifolium medium]